MKNTAMHELAGVTLITAATAIVGGTLLVVSPTGALLQMPEGLLNPTPFADYRVPGLILLLAVGGTQLIAGLLALKGSRRAGAAGLTASITLLGWMSVQLELIGYCHWSQGLYLGLAVVGAVLDVAVVKNGGAGPSHNPHSLDLAISLSIYGPQSASLLAPLRRVNVSRLRLK